MAHRADDIRAALSMVEIVFASPLERRRFFASEAFRSSLPEQARHIACLKAFAVSGVYTYVHASQLTTAGLRGSRAAELIERPGRSTRRKTKSCICFVTARYRKTMRPHRHRPLARTEDPPSHFGPAWFFTPCSTAAPCRSPGLDEETFHPPTSASPAARAGGLAIANNKTK